MTTLSAPIDAVTVYRAGALVSRSAIIADADQCPAEVRISDLPLALEDRSLRVRVEGGGGILAIDVSLGLDHASIDPSLAPVESAELRAARRRVVAVEDGLRHRFQQVKRLEAAIAVARPAGKEGEAPPPAPHAGRAAVAAMRSALLVELDRQIEDERGALREAKEALAELEARDKEASTARQARSHELRKCATIRLHRLADATGPRRLVLEYMVPGARWAPAYTITFDRAMQRATVAVRAVVAQQSGEEWRRVRLTLSTADAQRWTELPELQSVRIGRRQPAPARRGWRPPPEGVGLLYADYDAFVGKAPAVEAEDDDVPTAEITGSNFAMDELAEEAEGGFTPMADGRAMPAESMSRTRAGVAPPSSRSRSAPGPMAPPPSPPPAPSMAMAPPNPFAPQDMMLPAPKRSAGLFGAIGGMMGGGGGPGGPPQGGGYAREMMKKGGYAEPEPEFESPGDLLAYGDLRMLAPSAGRRGELVMIRRAERVRELVVIREEERVSEICVLLDRAAQVAGRAGLSLPPRHAAPSAVGGFDYVYAAEGEVEVSADGDYHAIPLFAREASVELVHVVVPREGSEVFRVVRLKNPLDAPLLAGPADIYVGGDYLLTSDLPLAAARGEVQIGLGVEQGIKVARNTRYAEESAGLMGGSLILRHQVQVEVDNRLDRPVEVEIRDRMPTLRDGEEEIQVDMGAEPPWETYEPEDYRLLGGKRWRAKLAPAAKQTFKATYAIKISAKKELVGGNRRES